ncbi:hypothetical protein [Frankia sp. R43]|uniref:hypothetical protein n=1 Tax=Frankia sp. R43 TaxID=269536 RepID=UPI000A7CDF65|nr:hypothetical protein [Frankia sp. R43]
MDTTQVLAVRCQICPDLAVETDDLFAGLDLAGAHDDTHHDGGTAAYVHVAQEA